MLSSPYRLRQRQYFDAVYRSGDICRGRLLTLRYLPAADVWERNCKSSKATSRPSRFAVVVSKKVSKRAVDRNRIKRRIRHQLKKMLADISPNYVVVISANRLRKHSSQDASSCERLRSSRNHKTKQPKTYLGAPQTPELLLCSPKQLHQDLYDLLQCAGLLSGTEKRPSHTL